MDTREETAERRGGARAVSASQASCVGIWHIIDRTLAREKSALAG